MIENSLENGASNYDVEHVMDELTAANVVAERTIGVLEEKEKELTYELQQEEKRLDEGEQVFSDESRKAFEMLPPSTEWPATIDNTVAAKQVAELYKYCESLTMGVNVAAAERLGKPPRRRTNSNPGYGIAYVVEHGEGTYELQDVPLAGLKTIGSSGSPMRQGYINAALEKYTPHEVFDRLPPIVLEKTGGAESHYLIIDGNTRTMIASKLQLATIRAYVRI